MNGTDQAVGAHVLGHEGYPILLASIPRGRGHHDLTIRSLDGNFVVAPIDYECSEHYRVSLLHRHEPWGKCVAVSISQFCGAVLSASPGAL